MAAVSARVTVGSSRIDPHRRKVLAGDEPAAPAGSLSDYAQPSARGTQGMRENSIPSSLSASACSGVVSP
jgi:hypothetical protein